MTLVFLIRHAECHGLGERLSGRLPGVGLTAYGQVQAAGLGERLARMPLTAVVSSPLERACDTAAALAEERRLAVTVDEAFHEVDFGSWTAATFSSLSGQEDWKLWNASRSRARCPGGESMAEVRDRAAQALERWARTFPQGTIAIVSHADVIRALLTHYLGMTLDAILRLEISPASVSAIEIDAAGSTRVLWLNQTGDLPGV
jgi:probable phosphoglycerate mutase